MRRVIRSVQLPMFFSMPVLADALLWGALSGAGFAMFVAETILFFLEASTGLLGR